MMYSPEAIPFKVRTLPNGTLLAVSSSGDHTFLAPGEEELIHSEPARLPLDRQAQLRGLFFLRNRLPAPGMARLLRSRQAAKRETVDAGPVLHIIVPTLQCAHSCKYCQVSRSLGDEGHTLNRDLLLKACESIFESTPPALTIEFQGGDPLLRFDLLKEAILRIQQLNETHKRSLRFVVASTLHQLTDEMCAFFKEHVVYLSTSLDGPAFLHNKNRPTPTRDSYERTLDGIALAREALGLDGVSALMTTTRESLLYPDEIVDEYVHLGFTDIFLRPLSSYGFAKRNQARLGYSLPDFQKFYSQAMARVLHWNRQGVELREVYASIILNKILSTFDSGYVDLQSPTGAGSSVLVYNYDGYIYPSDEARMLAEMGDTSLRMGRIGEPLSKLATSDLCLRLAEASCVDRNAGCRNCAYSGFCAPNPVDAQAQYGQMDVPVLTTEHCQRHMGLFDQWFDRLQRADDWELDLFHAWAHPSRVRNEPCAA